MQSKALTVEAYLQELSEERREALQAIRQVVCKNLDPQFQEGMQYGMIGYFVPHSLYPDGYHCDPKQPLPFAGLASQKGHISLYFMHLYADMNELKWFESEFAKTGLKLNMGKSCVRFRHLADVPLPLIGKTVKRISVTSYIALYEKQIRQAAKPSAKPSTKTNAKQAVAKATSKKTDIKKTASKTMASKTMASKTTASSKTTSPKAVSKKAVRKKAVSKKTPVVKSSKPSRSPAKKTVKASKKKST